MFYKPSSSTASEDSQPTEITSPCTDTDCHDSGLGSIGFRQDSGTENMSSLPLTTCGKEVDTVNTISGNFSNMTLTSKGVRLTSQSDIEQDSGHYDSVSSGFGSLTTTTLSSVGPTSSSTTQPSESFEDSNFSWVSTILRLCYPTESGEVCMENVVRMFQGNQDGDNWLNFAIIHEAQEAAHLLIGLAPDHDWLNLYNRLRQTPLHLAVLAGQPDIVRRLVCAGASVWEQDLVGNTPLHLACAMGREEMVRHFVTPVRHSETVQTSHHRCYRMPFQRLPQDTGLRNFDGDTCLHLAARAGHVNVVRILLEHGCDPNIGDGKSGRTVLHHCAQAGHLELTSLLLSRRETQRDVIDYGMLTPLDLAQGHHGSEIVHLLTSHGAAWCGQWSDSDSEDDDDDSMMDNGQCSG